MQRLTLVLACTLLLAGALVLAPRSATADNDTGIWTGRVVHVSTTNLKVHNNEGDQTLSFLVVPKFDQIFSDEGTTTYQMADIKPGMWVTVYYDQSALGARHADKIVLLHTGQQMKT
jgi:hypothetical protein